MASLKKGLKPTFLEEDDMSEFISESQYLKDSPKGKKPKRQRTNNIPAETDITKLVEQFRPSAANKKKMDPSLEMCKESRHQIMNVMGRQLEARKQSNGNLLNNLSEVLTQSEADYNAMKDNEKKLEQLTGALMKCIQQASTAQKQKLKMLKDIHSSFKKEVKGLISHGAMKPNDRPLWFDIYKAFPPILEPKYARPKPDIKPIRQILYQEDTVRAKFHSEGHGTGAVNMLNTTGETHTKKLLQQYNKLKADGVPEEELIEKSAEIVSTERTERQADKPKLVAKEPKSATAQMLAEANLKNIFKEEEK